MHEDGFNSQDHPFATPVRVLVRGTRFVSHAFCAAILCAYVLEGEEKEREEVGGGGVD